MILSTYTNFRAMFATSATLAADGMEVWPVSMLRASGFNGGITGMPKPVTAFPVTLTCNAEAVDGGGAFNWYLSQRTDDSAKQYLYCSQLAADKSGSVLIGLTSLGVAELGLAGPTAAVSQEHLIRVLKFCDLYVQRVSDKAIQHLLLLPATLGS